MVMLRPGCAGYAFMHSAEAPFATSLKASQRKRRPPLRSVAYLGSFRLLLLS